MEPKIIGGHSYRWSKLPPRRSFHVIRRILPVISGGADESFAGAVQAISRMNDETVNYVLDACLQRCERLDPESGNWFPVQKTPGVSQYDDMDASDELELSIAVLEESLTRF